MRNRPRPEYVQAVERDRACFDVVHLTEIGHPVVDARNSLAARALALAPRAEFVLWTDDDAWWPAGTIARMIEHLDERSAIDVLAGYFGGRDHFSPAFAWTTWNDPASIVDPGRTCAPRSLVAIEQCGFHFVLMRTSVLERVGAQPFALLSDEWTEDFCFIARCRATGVRTYVDTGAHITHVDDHGRAQTVGFPAGRIINGELVRPRAFERPAGPRQLGPDRAYGLPMYGAR